MRLPPAEPPSNTTVRRHLESGTLEARPSDDDEVAAFWRKALVAYDDSRLASSSLESRLLRAYDAGRIAAFAIVRSAGYRTRAGKGTITSPSTWHAASSTIRTSATRWTR
jgi:hypothetical protein